jgi:hypothetical protein
MFSGAGSGEGADNGVEKRWKERDVMSSTVVTWALLRPHMHDGLYGSKSGWNEVWSLKNFGAPYKSPCNRGMAGKYW